MFNFYRRLFKNYKKKSLFFFVVLVIRKLNVLEYIFTSKRLPIMIQFEHNTVQTLLLLYRQVCHLYVICMMSFVCQPPFKNKKKYWMIYVVVVIKTKCCMYYIQIKENISKNKWYTRKLSFKNAKICKQRLSNFCKIVSKHHKKKKR